MKAGIICCAMNNGINQRLGKVSRIFTFYLLYSLVLAACGNNTQTPTVMRSSDTPPLPSPSPTPTLVQESPTPQPLAAIVNGEQITLAEYQSELERYQAVVGTEMATEEKGRVLNDLVDRILLVQAASEAGFIVEEATVQQRYDQLVARLGSQQALQNWMATYGYSETEFRRELSLSVAAAWMRDQIAATVPKAVEQVYARQILLYNLEEAEEVLVELQTGRSFDSLAEEYDPLTKGNLGWFPRGYLLDQKLDEIAFNLQAGEFSDIVETSAGYHILFVVERDPEYPLSHDARLTLQQSALQRWLESRRNESDIQVFLP
jgi:parvulin-like peptidyl-prolyl isomerase